MCRACAGLSRDVAQPDRARAASQIACARCGSEVPLYETRPLPGTGTGTGGRIALACAACAEGHADARASAGAIANEKNHQTALRARAARRGQPAALFALALAVVLVVLYLRGQVPPRSAAAGSLREISLAGAAHASPSRAPLPGGSAAGAEHPVEGSDAEADAGDHELGDGGNGWLEDIDVSLFDREGELRPTIEDMRERSEPLEERLPTLADWIFPVPGSDETFPLKPTRRFGAGRDGSGPAECGDGHCGVDLDGPRGTPVVAVAWGVVTRIERRSDRRSGKYVRIEHPDYVYTAYMHLDDIAEDLRIGDEIQPGDVVGTLGRTGIKHSAPHLHFSLAVLSGHRLVHIDPAPFLERAERVSAR